MDENYDDDQHPGRTGGKIEVEWLDMLAELGEEQEKAAASYGEEARHFWNSLSREQQLMAFAHVNRTIHHGLKRGLSYRGILYSLFEFGPEAYGIGMASGFHEIYSQCDIEERKNDG